MAATNRTNRKPKTSRARKKRLAQKQANALNFETLEARHLLASITVSNATDVISPSADTSSITALIINDGGDGISIREAITASNNTVGDDTITFSSLFNTSRSINLSGSELEITDTLTITGSEQQVTLNANRQSRVLNFKHDSGDLTLTNLTLTRGITEHGGSLLRGGGIRFGSSGTLSLINSTVSENRTEGSSSSGGGIYTNSGTVSLINSTLSVNRTAGVFARGGGIYTKSGTVSLINSTLSDNGTTGGSSGGGVYTRSGNVSLINSTFNENRTAGSSGGGIRTTSGAIYLTDSEVRNSTGGGIRTTSGAIYLTNSEVRNNSGGGIATTSGMVSLTNSTVSGNGIAYGGSGGGIRTSSGAVSLTGSTVSGNSTARNSSGGGINTLSGAVSLTNSTVSGNSTAGRGSGGGIYTESGAVSLTNSTVSGNSITYSGHGGGIFTLYGSVTLHSSTVSANEAVWVGGGIAMGISSSPNSEQLTLVNSIVAGNTTSTGNSNLPGHANDVLAPTGGTNQLSVNHSLIGDNSGTSLIAAPVGAPDTNGNLIGSTVSPINPQLTPLADNGGPTQTHALLPQSPAFEAGNSTLATDQRGVARPIEFASISNPSGGNGSDIGAFELQTLNSFFPSVVLVRPDTSTPLNLSTALVVDEDGGNTTVTFNVPAGTFSTPADGLGVGDGVTATLVDLQTITLVGAAADINIYLNKYFENTSNLQYNPTAGAFGDSATIIGVTIDAGGIPSEYSIDVNIRDDVREQDSLLVTTAIDTGDLFDGLTSLRDAINFANLTPGPDTISFDPSVFAGGNDSVVRLTQGELEISDELTIDGATGTDVVVSGDADADDITFAGTYITDATTSFGGTAGAADDQLDDNSRLLNFSSATGGNLLLVDLTLTGGRTTGNNDNTGGGIRFLSTGTLSLTSSTVSGNSTFGGDADGGGISSSGGTVSLTNSTVSRNSTAGDNAEGGGISSVGGTVSLTNSTVSGNSTTGSSSDGGGIRIISGDLFLANSTVSVNSTTGRNADGGGVYASSGDVSLISSTVSGNSTTGSSSDGGGIYLRFGSVSLTSSTVSGNINSGEDSHGGGIYTRFGSVTLNDSTVTENQAWIGGGIDARGVLSTTSPLPTFTITNSIIAGNIDIGTAPDLRHVSRNTPTVNHSLIGVNVGTTLVADFVGSSGSGGNLIGTVNSPIDPLLAPLADNGGPTQTHALLPNSPALDAGNSTLSTDQRGFMRQIDFASINNPVSGDGSDIGAFELQTLNTFFPSEVLVLADTTSILNLSSAVVVDEDGGDRNVTISVAAGTFLTPADGSGVGTGVTATLVDAQTITLAGTAVDINRYFDNTSNLQYTPIEGAVGDDATIIDVTLDTGGTLGVFGIGVDIGSMVVTTASDVEDSFDGVTSLREAINFANLRLGSDAITFDASVFTGGANSLIRLTQADLEITDALTIDASAGTDVVITGDAEGDDTLVTGTFTTDWAASGFQRLNDNRRVLSFSATAGDATLTGLTITGGRTNGNNSVGEITNSGGGIRFLSEGTLNLTNSRIIGNSTRGFRASGGGIFTRYGNVTLSNSLVSNNSTVGFDSDGGGLYSRHGSVSLTNSTVSGNSTTGDRAGGGGICLREGSLTLSGSTVSSNSTTGELAIGGGIFSSQSSVTLSNSSVSGNSTAGENAGGGGIFTGSGTVSLTNSTVSGNSTTGNDADGGGIRTSFGAVSLISSTVSGNSTTGFDAEGGGIHISSDALYVTNSTISGNSSRDGGGIFAGASELYLTSTTVTKNEGWGGGIAFDPNFTGTSSKLTLVSSIVAGNTTFSNNPAFPGDANDLLAPAGGTSQLSLNYSLIGVNLGTPLVAAPLGSPDANRNLIGTPASPINPLLFALADNGGPTQTHALLSNSPAIDAGNSDLTTDQAGFRRHTDFSFIGNPVSGNGSDIGAFELQTLNAIFPTDVLAIADTTTDLNLSSALVVDADGGTANVTINVVAGTFSTPTDGSGVGDGVTATLVDPQTLTLIGAVVDINSYLDNTSNLKYVPVSGEVGDNASTIRVNVDSGDIQSEFKVNVDIRERDSLIVTTKSDVEDLFDGVTSLRDAINFANRTPGFDTITFDASIFTGGSNNLIRLTQGELEISEELAINGSTESEVVITGDANGDDRTVADTYITDVAASFGGTAGASSDRLDDNSRVINFSSSMGTLSLSNLTVTGGRTAVESAQGGGIRTFSGNVSLINSTVSGNSTVGEDAKGGGIFTYSGDVSLNNSIVSRNSTSGDYASGGGILTSSGDVLLVNSSVTGNSTNGNDADGGGIFTRMGNVSLTNSTLSGNQTSGDYAYGGGVFTFFGNVSLVNSTVSGNSTTGNEAYGGGIFTLFGDVLLTNSTLSGNSTSGIDADGGGIFTVDSTVLIVSSTVAYNSSSGVGGGIASRAFAGEPSERLTIINSIVAGNTDIGTAPDLLEQDGVNALIVEHSLIGDVAGSGISATSGTGNILNQSALLAPLADNNGPTLTHALLPGSPAIDAGSAEALVDLGVSLTTDQRGPRFARSFDDPDASGSGIDIGSFERQALTLVVDHQGDETDGDFSQGELTLREAIDLANSVIGSNTITFDGSVFTGGSESVIRLTQGELEITEELTIDGSTGTDVVITGDTNGDDVTVAGTFITDVAASFGGNLGGADDLLDDNSRVINFSSETGDLTLSGLTLTGGRTTEDNQFNFFGDLISDNNSGGGILFGSSGVLSLTNSSISGNSTVGFDAKGGGVFTDEGSVSLVNSSVSENATIGEGASGGGIHSSYGNVSLSTSTVAGNSTLGESARGGGISTFSGDISLDSSVITGNGTYGESGDVFNRYGSAGGGISTLSGDVGIIDSTVSGNKTIGVAARGGGIYSQAGYISLTNAILSGNSTSGQSADGGGISTAARRSGFFPGNVGVALTDSTVDGNWTSGSGADGGGIFVYSRSFSDSGFSATNSTVSGNSTLGAFADGGGIYARSTRASLINSSIQENSTHGLESHGGGIFVSGFSSLATPSFANSTVTGNSTFGENANGGGIYSRLPRGQILSSTITENSASGVGGGIGSHPALTTGLTISNSIVAGNTDNGTAPEVLGTETDSWIVSHSLIGDTTGSGITGSTGNRNILNQPALLGPLANNGGPTLTHTLLSGSPAIDGGSNTLAVDASGTPLIVDQRGDGFNRSKFGRVDIGAFESNFDAPPIAPSVLSATVDEGGELARPDLWNSLTVVFDTNVTVAAGDLSLVNDSTGGIAVDLTGVGFSYDAITGTATWDFGTLDSPLEAAFYTYQLNAGSIVSEGLALDGNLDKTGGDDFVGQHYVVIPGDLNLDGDVDISQIVIGPDGVQNAGDASILLANLPTTSGATYYDGDLNGDGDVDITQIVIGTDGVQNVGDASILLANLGGPFVPSSDSAPLVADVVRDEDGVLARPDLLNTFVVAFDRDVNVSAGDLIVRNDTLGTMADTSSVGFDYNATNLAATWDFSGAVLDAAFYTFELSDTITSVVGELALDGDNNGDAGGSYFEEVYVSIPGDLNMDGDVDVSQILIGPDGVQNVGDASIMLASLPTVSGATYHDGDLNGDGDVDISQIVIGPDGVQNLGDASILLANLGRSVLPPANLSSTAASVLAGKSGDLPQPVAVRQTFTEPLGQWESAWHQTVRERLAIADTPLTLSGANQNAHQATDKYFAESDDSVRTEDWDDGLLDFEV